MEYFRGKKKRRNEIMSEEKGKVNYEGYLWYSDKKEPKIYTEMEPLTEELKPDDSDNPFIIEGQLYDEGRNLSCSVKYVDGHYIVKECDIQKELKGLVINDKYYQSNRMDNKILHFKECWKTENDPLCCDMEVLQPSQIVFVGFKK